MIDVEISKWCEEVVQLGAIAQDDDDTVSEQAAVERFDRYVELIDMVDGDEPQEVFQAIVDSIRSDEDYGAYEATYNALWRFPPDKYAEYFVGALPRFIRRYGDSSGRFLLGLVGWAVDSHLPPFNEALAQASPEARTVILDYVRTQEREGWFEDDIGLIGASNDS